MSFLSNFPFKVLHFCSASLGAHRFYFRLILFLHRSARLIQVCFPMRYSVIICLYFRFFFLTFFQSLFLVDGYSVFFSNMSFFINSSRISFSCGDICFVMLECGDSVFNNLFCNSGRRSCFSVFKVSILEGATCPYSSLFTCLFYSGVSRSEKTFFNIILPKLKSVWLVLYIVHYVQISIILLLNPLWMNYIFLDSLSVVDSKLSSCLGRFLYASN